MPQYHDKSEGIGISLNLLTIQNCHRWLAMNKNAIHRRLFRNFTA